MYSETGDPGDGYLTAESDGRAVGGFVVRWIEFSNAPAQWLLSWVWVLPSHRRRGLMQTAWLMVVGKYPGIDPDPPFSKALRFSFENGDDVSDRIRRYAQSQLAADNF